ncbi:alkaline shock response membrane anchor protein AmaP [Naumannella cuiyingiana]|uniref:Alkaline shock response membrane anchor protein AmaP n=1 Tax=Naumannella cuiyingiana TaxID=1347891 RepID=A0A7Z0D6M1_9ACTN|nr:alkaline shock response membrane anchor protein AmaP [Naumannella cuiyingiana]NYI69880.1 hypothetical protein [Naumannella cuiyingiana]
MAVPRRNGPSGPNRFWLFVIGLLAVLGGLVAGAIALGLANPALQAVGLAPIAPADPNTKLVGDGQVPLWAWRGVAAVGVVLFLLGLVWLIAQFPRPIPAKPFRLTTDPARGTTVVDTGALESAVAEGIEDIPGVVGSSVTVRGMSTEPVVEVRVSVNELADVRRVLEALETGPVSDLATSLGGRVADLRVFVDATGSTRSEGAITLSRGEQLAAS